MAELTLLKQNTSQQQRVDRPRPDRRVHKTKIPRSLSVGGVLVALFLLIGLLAPQLAPFPPEQIAAGGRLDPPSAVHPFGTDHLGRDLFSRVVHGARLALKLSLLGAGLSAGVGIALGLMAGYFGRWLDQLLSRLLDVWLAVPGLLLAIVIVARLGPSLDNAIIALAVVGVPSFFRLARSGALSARQQTYVTAVRAVGASDGRIIVRHILPNVAPSLIVLLTTRLGVLILAGGGLSFIGLGAQPPQPEWGALLAAGRDYLALAPWLAWFPGLCITLTVVGINLLGDGLRDLSSPR